MGEVELQARFQQFGVRVEDCGVQMIVPLHLFRFFPVYVGQRDDFASIGK